MRIDRFLPTPLRKPVLLLGGLALLLLAAGVAFRGWDRYVEDRLARWAIGEVAGRTGGAYRLTLGDLSFLPLAGSISFDSATITTDSARNRLRETPLPGLAWRGHECRVSGLDVPGLLLRKSFAAHELGCRRVVAVLTLVAGDKERRSADSAGPPVSTEDLGRSLGLRAFRVSDVSFPSLGVKLERPGPRGGLSVVLDSARFDAKDLRFDPSAEPRTDPILSADRARLAATGVRFHPDSLIELGIARLEAGFTDQTLALAGVRHEPSIPESEWVRRVRERRDRIRFELDSLEARGFDWLGYVTTGGIEVRALELRGARFDVLSDRRIPLGRPKRHRTPQQVAAARAPAVRVDSLLVAGGIVYRERRPGRERPGRVTFDAVHATVTHLDLPSRGRPLTIAARAKVMNEGALTVDLAVPLDAPDLRYELSGRLGPMPAGAFNGFLSENEAFEFAEGTIEEITFRQTARDALAKTTLTPRYRDLSVEPTGDGGGIIGSVKRSVTKFVANALVVRSHNPADDGDDLRVARTARVYVPTNTWVQFLWFSLRDALMVGLEERPDADRDGDGEGDREQERGNRSAKP